MQGVTGGGAAGQQGGLAAGGVQSTATGEGISDNRDQGEPHPPVSEENSLLKCYCLGCLLSL